MPAPARGAMADQLLFKKRRIFIHSVGAGTINALLDCLLEDRVISQEDMNKVRDENDTVMDKARVLIDLVIGKGPEACRKFIRHLCEEDPPLASKMGLRKGIVYNYVHSTLPEDGEFETFIN
uniref:Caspase recruitment domain family member 18 n=1 Tax=Callithrix jacchus TaxID=9483 RepID=A0A5F4W7S1_CALJA